MESDRQQPVARVGGLCAIAGSLCAQTGAALLAVSGADLDVALVSGQIGEYLDLAGQARGLLIATRSPC